MDNTQLLSSKFRILTMKKLTLVFCYILNIYSHAAWGADEYEKLISRENRLYIKLGLSKPTTTTDYPHAQVFITTNELNQTENILSFFWNPTKNETKQ